MDFIEQIYALAARITKLQEHIKTEEASKQAFVIPFIQILGYDVFDPTEVTPELTADVGIKKGEKVDYAIMRDGEPIILFECKWANGKLQDVHGSQLYRYFSVTKARVAVLTNGIVYRFYTDLDEPNKMDSRPFLEFNMLDIQEPLVAEVKKLSKATFDVNTMLSSAIELRYTKEIKQILEEQFKEPHEEFVRFFTSRIYTGRITQAVRDQFAEITRRALHHFVNEKISSRLRSAMESEGGQVEFTPLEPEVEPGGSAIETTPEELEGFMIVKAILREVVDLKRIAHRDTKSYFGVLLDDNNRRPICRLHFNRTQKYLGIFDGSRDAKGQQVETRVVLGGLDDIYLHADKLKQAVMAYSTRSAETETTSSVALTVVEAL